MLWKNRSFGESEETERGVTEFGNSGAEEEEGKDWFIGLGNENGIVDDVFLLRSSLLPGNRLPIGSLDGMERGADGKRREEVVVAPLFGNKNPRGAMKPCVLSVSLDFGTGYASPVPSKALNLRLLVVRELERRVVL